MDLSHDEFVTFYTKLQPTPRKVLKSLIFPDNMTPEQLHLCSHVKRFVRDMDHEYLALFLRFCTGSDMYIDRNISVRFTATTVSDSVRCPTSQTCGCVLEIPDSYARDPYISLKADFMAMLKNRYWQMDII